MSESTRIDAIRIIDRHRKEFGDIDSLAQSIREVGLLQPVVITPDLRLVAGERRIRAARSLGWTTIPARIVSNLTEASDLLRAERDENTCRMEMTVSERVSLAEQIEALEKPKAAERMAEGGRRGGTSPGTTVPPLPADARRAADIAGEAVGMSRVTYARAKYVIDVAEDEAESPEVRQVAREAVEQMDKGQIGIKGAQSAVNRAAGRPENTTVRGEGKRRVGTLTRPQPPKLGGNRKKHAAVIESITTSLAGLAMAAGDITEFDNTVTQGEAARLADDLSSSLRSLNRLKQNLYRKATP